MGKKKGIIIGIVILLIILIGCGLFWVFKKDKTNVEQTSNEVGYTFKEKAKVADTYTCGSDATDLSVFNVYKNGEKIASHKFEGKSTICNIGANDGDVYLHNGLTGEEEANFVLYKYNIESDKIELIYDKTEEKEDFYYSILFYTDEEEKNYLLGFFKYNDETIKLCNLEGNCYDVNGYDIADYNDNLGVYIESKDYIVINNENGYGLLSLKTGEVIIEPQYTNLTFDDNVNSTNLIATKDGKMGIIDITNKVVVDFQYSFIEAVKGEYIVNKDNRLAIMDTSYNLVTDYTYDYELSGACDYGNCVYGSKVKDNYILWINDGKDKDSKQNGFYIISKDGVVADIEDVKSYYIYENNIVAIEKNSTDGVTYYDSKGKELFTTSVEYSYNTAFPLPNIIYEPLEDDTAKYYNYSTYQEVTNMDDLKYEYYNIRVEYKEDGLYDIYVSDEKMFSLNVDDRITFNDDGSFEIYISSEDRTYEIVEQ